MMYRKSLFALMLNLCIFMPQAMAQVLVAEGSKNNYLDTVAAHAVDEPMLQINIENPAANPHAEVTEVTVTAEGTGHDVDDLTSGSVKAYWDKNGDGRINLTGNNPDVYLNQANFNADNGRATITGFNFTLLKGTETNLLIVYSLEPSATAGKSFRARLAANSDLKVRDAAELTPLTVSGAPVEGYLRSVGAGTLTFTRVAQAPDGAVAIPNRTLLPLICLQVYANDVEPIKIISLKFADIGSADGVSGILPDKVKLFQTQSSQTTPPTSSSIAIATGSFATDNGVVTLTPTAPLIITRNSNTKFWVTADLVDAAAETIGNTYQIKVPATDNVVGTGETSLLAPSIVGADINGPEWEFNYNPLLIGKPSDLGVMLIPAGAQRYPLFAFQIKNDPTAKSEKVNISKVRVHLDGTLNDKDAITSCS